MSSQHCVVSHPSTDHGGLGHSMGSTVLKQAHVIKDQIYFNQAFGLMCYF